MKILASLVTVWVICLFVLASFLGPEGFEVMAAVLGPHLAVLFLVTVGKKDAAIGLALVIGALGFMAGLFFTWNFLGADLTPFLALGTIWHLLISVAAYRIPPAAEVAAADEDANRSPKAMRRAKACAIFSIGYIALILIAAIGEFSNPDLETNYFWPAVLVLASMPFIVFLWLVRSGRIRAAGQLGISWGIVATWLAFLLSPPSLHVSPGLSGTLLLFGPLMVFVEIGFATAAAVVLFALPRRPFDSGRLLLTLIGCASYVVFMAFVASPVRGHLYPVYNTMISSSVHDLRTIATSQITFVAVKGRYGTIDELIQEGLLSDHFKGTRSGYKFSIVASADDYTATAKPEKRNYSYYVTADGVVRYLDNLSGNPAGAPVQ